MNQPKANKEIVLNCLIFGQDSDQIFDVTIANTRTVKDLKCAIKEERRNRFSAVLDAEDLAVFQFPRVEEEENLDAQIQAFKPGRALHPRRVLNKLDLVEDQLLHFIVVMPPPLNCLVFGDNSSRIFDVTVANTHTVKDFKCAIKEEISVLRDVDPRTLDVFQFPHVEEEELDAEIQAFKPGRALRPGMVLNELGLVKDQLLHFIVKAPYTDLPLHDVFTLNCLVFGDDSSRIFQVTVPKMSQLAALRDAIKGKVSALRDVDAHTLDVFQFPHVKEDDLDAEIQAFKPEHAHALHSVKVINGLNFAKNQLLHFIVKAPYTDLLLHEVFTLNCLVFGDDSSHIFQVTVPKMSQLAALRDAIKEKKRNRFSAVDADELDVYGVSVSPGKIAGDLLSDKTPLQPLDKLPTLFGIAPPGDKVHIVVRPRLAVETQTSDEEEDIVTELANGKVSPFLDFEWLTAPWKAFVRTCTLQSDSRTPSAAAKSNEYVTIQGKDKTRIYDGHYPREHPVDTNAPPIQLFNPAFAYFSSKAFDPNYNPPPDFIRNVRELSTGFAAIYHSEELRSDHLQPLLEKVLDRHIFVTQNRDRTTPDGQIFSQRGTIPLMIEEEKNEFGDGGSDPSTQVSFSFLRVYSQAKAEQLRNKCCCPTFLIAHAGPWLAVLGGVISSRCIVQRLTDYIWVPVHSVGDDRHYFRIARVLYALKESIDRLESWTQHVMKSGETFDTKSLRSNPSSPLHPRFCPTPNVYLRGDTRVTFEYLQPLERYPSCVTYLARTTEDRHKVVVKFVTEYGNEAHHMMGEAGYAPKLLFYGPINVDADMPSYGNLRMVVMDYVDGLMLCDAKEKRKVPPDFHSDLAEAIQKLHDEGFVFGDLREPNIMITNDDKPKVQLIDFNWAGKKGEARYPVSISRSIQWPEGVQGLELIDEAHDKAMLKFL
ncbi:hypothetical protein F5I97DRAFT_1928318 [Phlebopus sp. FC_14]|nr:hypothetical protein F5I97DRAFT_1928318 [Phlebopus sp. FC_14]